MYDRFRPQAGSWQRPFWLALLVAAGVGFSLGLACATPFAAFAAVAACTLPRRDAYYLTAALWLVNQAVGFTVLHYPWTAESLAWGAALGLTALVCTLAACATVGLFGKMRALVQTAAAFAVAFVVYEAILIAFSAWLGGLENFTLAIQGKILFLNGVALALLAALNWIGTRAGIGYPVARER